MATNAKPHRWETRPIEVWNKAKELRQRFERNVADSNKTKRELFVLGADRGFYGGFENVRMAVPSPQGMMMEWAAPKYALQCRAKSEMLGQGRETCGYHQNLNGAIALNRHYLGTPYPKPALISPAPAVCAHHQYEYQVPADLFGCPYIQASSPMYSDPPDPAREKALFEGVVRERLDILEQTKRYLGREFSEEAYIQEAKYEMQIHSLKQQAMVLQKNIPAPLSCKDMYSFMTLGGMQQTDREDTMKFWKELKDELEWRVKNKIAAVAYERYRWVEEHPPPWRFLKYYRYMEKYGAVCLGTTYSGLPRLVQQLDGSWAMPPSPLERGVPLNTIEDVIRAHLQGQIASYGGYDDRLQGLGWTLNHAKAYKADGAFLSLWRSASGCCQARREVGLQFKEAGMPVLYFEGSQPGDGTDLDENRMLDQLDVWMEMQGLRKIED